MVAPYLAHSALNSTDSVDPANIRLRIADRDAPGSPLAATRLAMPLTDMLTMELDGAAGSLGLAADELLLAALGRTIARTIGHGVVAVDVARNGRAGLQPVDLTCATERQVSADDAVGAVHRALAAMPHRAIRHGILHYFGSAHPASELFFNDLGERAEAPAGQPVAGHALELRLYRTAAGIQLEWWYDSSRFDRVTVLELTEQFPFALIELTSEATAAA
ncbi:hypothetical protein O6P37_12315 [Mycobacterium sp. CPCC 205372]|uniref:Phenolpthiocerol synthesis type-i polyketide synthase ppse n=1 Tax=Mycobacterium hippophais TaxID=3016340 RepID=A0ABT4PSZ4_9MYCO|nr:hypothetical protein [Mycobacterium hippophais]MCZ8379651.1 hypothetical protein [Mycobacterium hippophais]